MPTPLTEPPPGDRTELARYELETHQRVIYAYAQPRALLLTDEPVRPGAGPAYVIEPRVEPDALDPLVADYVRQSIRRGRPAIEAPLGA